METLAAVLLQLNLFDVDSFSDHLAPLFSSEEAVSQRAIYCNGLPLLSDLVSGLKFVKEKRKRKRGKCIRENSVLGNKLIEPTVSVYV